jgi:hypothetical protein
MLSLPLVLRDPYKTGIILAVYILTLMYFSKIIIVHILAFSSTYLQVSMWKQVLRNEQSPRLSSVCFWIIFLKCNFLHGSAAFTLVHSTLVPCGQNSITCAPIREAHILNKVHGGLLE